MYKSEAIQVGFMWVKYSFQVRLVCNKEPVPVILD